jgi:hypothetical protein
MYVDHFTEKKAYFRKRAGQGGHVVPLSSHSTASSIGALSDRRTLHERALDASRQQGE